MKLSKRLQTISDIIKKYSNHGLFADIGSDHGYLPVELVLKDVFSYAYACDIADGPLQACQNTINLTNTCHLIEVKKGDGLKPVFGKELDIISICGMGGNLICQILDSGLNYLSVNTLVIEANINEPLVRSFLSSHGWKIVDEDVVEDMGHYYEIIVAKKGNISYSEKELYLGPIFLIKKPEIIYKKWEWQKGIVQKISISLNETSEKYKIVHQQYLWLEEALCEN